MDSDAASVCEGDVSYRSCNTE